MPISKLDVGDEDQVSERDSALQDQNQQSIERFAVVLSFYEGREFVWNLLSWCKIFGSAPFDTEEIVRFEGRRDVGLYVLDKCFTSSPDAYKLMQQEAQKRDLEEKRD